MQTITVTQLNTYIHTKFETDQRLRSVAITGELSNVKYHYTGHIYFSLKDEQSVIAAVMFKGSRVGCNFQMQDGQKVVVYGSVSVYERDGRYQIYANRIELSGEGDLYEKYEELRKRLLEMGMFDAMYKKEIPQFVRTLGVVTAPTGAAVRDIINVSKRRFPYIQIILYPAKVQGEGAAFSVAEGIRALDEYGVDCIICGRGGGSIEDLWAFNEEIVARAIFECETPVISAVGHETDTTIADWVADLRAPTPSAAAELAVFDYEKFLQKCFEKRARIIHLMNQKLMLSRERLMADLKQLKARSPKTKLKEESMRLVSLYDRLDRVMNNKIKECRDKIEPLKTEIDRVFDKKLTGDKHRVMLYAKQLEGLSPLLKLSQGYSMVEGSDGRVMTSVKKASKGEVIQVHLLDGDLDAAITDIRTVNRNGK